MFQGADLKQKICPWTTGFAQVDTEVSFFIHLRSQAWRNYVYRQFFGTFSDFTFGVCISMLLSTKYSDHQCLHLRRNWVPPLPHPRKRVLLPLFGSKGGRHTRVRGRGWGDLIPTKGQTLMYFYVYYNPSTIFF
jgi:hypothetical protein